MLDLHEWDEQYILCEVARPGETRLIEKKAAAMFRVSNAGKVSGDTRQEIAKQISAFANASHGFLVFGIGDDGQPDGGVPIAIGRQPTNEWIEAVAARAVTPPIHGCEARMIQMAHHGADRGLLVLSIPLSDARPHWDDEGGAYIRAGAHSLPMPIQTLLDMASRGTTAVVEIVSVDGGEHGAPSGTASFSLRSIIRLTRGAICHKWAFDLFIEEGNGAEFSQSSSFPVLGVQFQSARHVGYFGQQPLLPGRDALGVPANVTIRVPRNETDSVKIRAELSAEAASPIKRWFRIEDFNIVPVGG